MKNTQKTFITFLTITMIIISTTLLIAKEKNLLVHYDFSTGKGKVLQDKSGNDYHGKIYNAKWIKTKFGNALQFSGKKCEVRCPRNTDLDMGKNDWTITLFVKIPKTTNKRIYFIFKGAGAGFNGYRFEPGVKFKLTAIIGPDFKRYKASGKKTSYLYPQGNGLNGKPINDGNWHFLTVVYKRKGNMQLYVDGQKSGKPKNIKSLVNEEIKSTDCLRIYKAHSDENVVCVMVDAAIYKKAFTATQVKELHADIIQQKMSGK